MMVRILPESKMMDLELRGTILTEADREDKVKLLQLVGEVDSGAAIC